jgi:hypothetical protein
MMRPKPMAQAHVPWRSSTETASFTSSTDGPLPAQDGIADIAMPTEAKRDFTTTLRQACSVVPGGRTLGALGPFR